MSVKTFLDYASRKYYEGSPIITDAEFDYLAGEHKYTSVGYEQKEDTVKHIYPLFSLQKMYVGEDDYASKLPEPLSITPKLDGAALALVYFNNNLVSAITRGDGIRGKDVTANVMTLDIPKRIQYSSLVQIVGELVAPIKIKNARNYAAGAMGLKDPQEFASRGLTFIAYDFIPHYHEYWSKDMALLREYGFKTVMDSQWLEFPRDGEVWRCDSCKKFVELGFTEKHPRGAFALKTRQEGVVTKLLDVVWQVGKSGVVSPVAILEPVMVGDATISRATLHNMKYIEDLELEIGCNVEIIRSGEIIPRVVKRV